ASRSFGRGPERGRPGARAGGGLADASALLGDWEYGVLPPREALPRAKAAAVRALQLDDQLGEAHTSLAFCLDVFDWDFPSAEKEFRRAIELNPGYATAHHWYAWHLSLAGRNDAAIEEMGKARQLDPRSSIINAELAELLLIAHRPDASIEQSRKAIEMDPGFPLAHNQLGVAYLQRRLFDDAIAELSQAVQLSAGSPTCNANLARAFAAAGRKDDAQRVLRGLEAGAPPRYSHTPHSCAARASLGETDQAMAWLEKSYEGRFNPSVLLRP